MVANTFDWFAEQAEQKNERANNGKPVADYKRAGRRPRARMGEAHPHGRHVQQSPRPSAPASVGGRPTMTPATESSRRSWGGASNGEGATDVPDRLPGPQRQVRHRRRRHLSRGPRVAGLRRRADARHRREAIERRQPLPVRRDLPRHRSLHGPAQGRHSRRDVRPVHHRDDRTTSTRRPARSWSSRSCGARRG
jgi:hypothetical protein